MTTIDLFREFNKEATTKSYPQSARNLYHTLLWVWNERRRPETVSLPRQALLTLTGLNDSTFRDAFSYLSSRRWVCRLNSRNRVTYTYKLCGDRVEPAPAARFPIDARAEKRDKREGKFPSEEISLPCPEGEDDGLTREASIDKKSPSEEEFADW